MTTTLPPTRTTAGALPPRPRYAAPPTPQALATRLGIALDQVRKLDSNESPYGAPPAARAALAALLETRGALPGLGRYPDPAATDLRAALATYTGVATEQIVVGNGSDELIALLAELLLEPGDEALVCAPTFSLYALAAGWRGATVVDAGRDADFGVTPERLLAALTPRTRVVFLCAPNNPTGTPLDRATLLAALDRLEALHAAASDAVRGRGAPVVIVDEAYYEVGALGGAADAWTAAPLVAAGRSLVVLRTFSKAFGLAGLRVGYGLCPADLATRLRERKQPYNVNIAGLVAARAALDEQEWVRARMTTLLSERTRVAHGLAAYAGLRVFPSAANFLLVECEAATPAAAEQRCVAIWEALLQRGLLVRRPHGEELGRFLRITIGTPEENDLLLAALAKLGELLPAAASAAASATASATNGGNI